eukprot:CAMPEP_0196773004 /NCGR_PEP_ID=MMETSP1104-20130614/2533_1 /TAXON_ID=33652 /ORGANISM="Cafeteria sp., Strain Caron Lab Isolate" /LENGTH=347 /DNA_ID=CAMNT_0042143147 /DNA_START=10 /DNA_END=1053 /DNA_ORIENTATION=-
MAPVASLPALAVLLALAMQPSLGNVVEFDGFDASAHVSASHPRLIDGDIIAAVFSPFNEDASALNMTVLPEQAKFLCDSGVKWVFVGGTTGESLSLGVDERKQLAEEWMALSRTTCISVIVHVGHESLLAAQELAAHAQSIGARAIAAMPPVFFKPATVEILADFMAQVAATAPKLPFYYYHIPSMTGVSFKMSDFISVAASRIPSFNGIKFTDYDLQDFAQCARFNATGRTYEMLFGRDEEMLAAKLFGASGFVGSTYNYAGHLFNELLEAYANNDMSSALLAQARAQEFIRIMQQYSANGVAANKMIGVLRTGVPLGPPRLPQVPIQDVSSLKDALDSIGFFNWS